METEDPIIVMGERSGWGDPVPFGLRQSERGQHLHVVGQTGTGKSGLLKALMLQDIEAGRGIALIDPHGQLARDIIDHIPPSRTDDVIYFDPTLPDPVTLNLFRNSPDWYLAASKIVSSLRHIWDDSWGPRMNQILTATAAALLQCENTSMAGILRMLNDHRYRQWVTDRARDPAIREYWEMEFPDLLRRFGAEAVGPVQNKVGLFFFSPHLRRVLSHPGSKAEIREVMDRRQIFIADISKGRLGETSSRLLGALLVSSFEQAAWERDPRDAPPFFLYCDEFQNYATDSFAAALSETRKYGLYCTLAHQYLGQLGEGLPTSVFGNVGSFVSFRVGEEDAQVLARQYGGKYSPSQFTGLANFEVCARLLSGDPFLGKTVPASPTHSGRSRLVRKQSRKRFAVKEKVAERRMREWRERIY